MKIAISGKGGVGKTTICAVLAQMFAEDGFEVIAVDADSDANLCSAFGIPAQHCPEPLIEMKQLIAERTGTGKEAVGAYFRLNPRVNDLPDKHFLNLDSLSPEPHGEATVPALRLLVLGAIDKAGAGCACPEGAFLKAMLAHTVLHRKEIVLIDLAAGLEFMGRSSIKGIDALIVVVEPGSRSTETAVNIAKMGRQLGVRHIAAIINKVTANEQVQVIKSQLGDLQILGSIDYETEVQQADLCRQSVYQAGKQLVEKLRQSKDALNNLIDGRKSRSP
ncbi:MAG: ATP-binding protein [Planctomycetota bacterium]